LNGIDVTSNPKAGQCCTLSSKNVVKNKNRLPAKCSVGFMKRVARMSDMDRKAILKIMKHKERKLKVRKKRSDSKAAVNSTMVSSNNSSLIGNNEWQNWVLVHGNSKAVADDVRNIGKAVGVQYKCDTTNSFNLLTREGRKEWRAAGGGEGVRGVMGVNGGGGEEC
jgi:hypothetical protein